MARRVHGVKVDQAGAGLPAARAVKVDGQEPITRIILEGI